MALFQNDIDNLKKGAINYLYIFADEKAGLSPDFFVKRNQQIDALKEIYVNNPEYSFTDLVQIINNGIVSRYGKTPAQLLQGIYEAATVKQKSGVGASDTDIDLSDPNELAALESQVDAYSQNVNGSSKNFWSDVKSVIDYLVELFLKLFGKNRDITYSPVSRDWTGTNNPLYYKSSTSEAGIGSYIFPIAIGTAIIWFLSTSPNGQNKPKKSAED